MVMKTHTPKGFELMDIPRGMFFIFAGAVVLMIAGGVYAKRAWRFWTI